MSESPRLEELKRRVQLDPASIAFAALAEEYRRAGRYAEAITTCRSGLRRHPSYISAHVTLGRALIEVGDYEEAREELEFVLRIAPENLAAIRGIAEIHHRRGDRTDTSVLDAQTLAEMSEAVLIEDRSTAAPPVEPFGRTPLPEALTVVGDPMTLEYVGGAVAAAPPPPLSAPPPPIAAVVPAQDPALASLEAFLEAVLHARESVRNLHLS